jgi:hypothetical protein
MVTIVGLEKRKAADGKEFNVMNLQGSVVVALSKATGKSPLLLTDGCKYIRDDLQAYWLFDAILTYQMHKSLRDINFHIWELQQLKKDFTWLLTCREDTGKRPLISQSIEFSDFPVGYIRI